MGDETGGGTSSKLDSLGKDELVKLVKKYILLHKQLKNKNEGELFYFDAVVVVICLCKI